MNTWRIASAPLPREAMPAEWVLRLSMDGLKRFVMALRPVGKSFCERRKPRLPPPKSIRKDARRNLWRVGKR